jgi:hypothetical protein
MIVCIWLIISEAASLPGVLPLVVTIICVVNLWSSLVENDSVTINFTITVGGSDIDAWSSNSECKCLRLVKRTGIIDK